MKKSLGAKVSAGIRMIRLKLKWTSKSMEQEEKQENVPFGHGQTIKWKIPNNIKKRIVATSILLAVASASQANSDQLITNARLGVYSQFPAIGGVTSYNKIGNPIHVSSWSSSARSKAKPDYITCTTTNTEGLKVGKLIVVTSGDKSLRNTPHVVYSVSKNASFGFYLEDNTQGANPSAITVYEYTPGGIAGWGGTGDAMDGFNKDATLVVQRQWMGDFTTPPIGSSYYGAKLTKGSNASETLYFARFLSYPVVATWNNRYDPDWVKQLQGQTVVGGYYIHVPVAGTVKVALYDGSTETQSSACPVDDGWHLVQVSTTISRTASTVQLRVNFTGGTNDYCYVSNPTLKVGSSLTASDMLPIYKEILIPDTRIIPLGWESRMNWAATHLYLQVEPLTAGSIPKGCKGMEFQVEGLCNKKGSHLDFEQSPTTQKAFIIGPYLVAQEDNMFNTSFGTVFFTNIDFAGIVDYFYMYAHYSPGGNVWSVSMNIGKLYF